MLVMFVVEQKADKELHSTSRYERPHTTMQTYDNDSKKYSSWSGKMHAWMGCSIVSLLGVYAI